MRIRSWHKINTWNLRTFLSVSMGLHLLFLSSITLLVPASKISQLPPLNIEISLLPIVTQEKPISVPLPSHEMRTPAKKEEKKLESSVPSQPVSVPILEDVRTEMRSTEEGTMEKEQEIEVTNLPLNQEVMETLQEPELEVQDSTLQALASSGEEKKEPIYPSLSHEEVLFTQPRYAENQKPLYPQEARMKGYQGEVVLKVEVLASGRVGKIEVKISSGHEILDRSALAAVRQWKFVPARKGESVIPFWVNIPIKFQLQ